MASGLYAFYIFLLLWFVSRKIDVIISCILCWSKKKMFGNFTWHSSCWILLNWNRRKDLSNSFDNNFFYSLHISNTLKIKSNLNFRIETRGAICIAPLAALDSGPALSCLPYLLSKSSWSFGDCIYIFWCEARISWAEWRCWGDIAITRQSWPTSQYNSQTFVYQLIFPLSLTF